MTAWSAKVVASSICLSVKGRAVDRVMVSTPIGSPSRSSGTPSTPRLPRALRIPGAADIAVIDLLVIVVFDLHDLIAGVTSARIAFLGAESASTNQHFFDAFRQGCVGMVIGDEFSSKWLELLKEAVPNVSR